MSGGEAMFEPAMPLALCTWWTDDDGRPLGGWVEVGEDEWAAILREAGGYDALSVFSTLTDPDGDYGPARIYTAWGRPSDPYPLVDIDDEYLDGREAGRTGRVLRKFVPCPPSSERSGDGDER